MSCDSFSLALFQQWLGLLDLPIGFKVCFPMDVSSRTVTVAVIFFLTFILNLFFGYFRAKAGKYSLKWFFYIHLPIPAIILTRIHFGIDYRYIPFFVVAAVLGQFFGGKLEI
jgi:hypothetical protein